MADEAVSIRVDSDSLVQLGRLMRQQADGKALRKDVMTDLKTAVDPGVRAVQGKLRSIPAASGAVGKPPLGTALASRVKPQVRLSGRQAGVAIRIARTPNLRGFTFAARRLNRSGWKHPVFGHDVWVEQQSPIEGFFDDTLQADKPQYRAAVIKVLQKAAYRLTHR